MKKTRFATVVVTSLLLFLAVFTVTMTVMFWQLQVTPDTLIVSVFGVIACEFVSLAAKRIFEKKKEDSDD